MLLQTAFLLLHRDAGPVTHELVGAGQCVEQGSLTAVGVARQRDLDLFFHMSLLSVSLIDSHLQNSLDLDHFGVGLPQAQLVAADGDLHGVA